MGDWEPDRVRKRLSAMNSTLTVGRAGLVLVALSVSLAACAAPGTPALKAGSSCEDYLAAPAEVRHDAAIRASVKVGANNPGNPMWGLNADAACGASPSSSSATSWPTDLARDAATPPKERSRADPR